MKPPPGLAVGFVLMVVAASGVLSLWSRYHTVYATSENESCFLKGYDPHDLIARYRSDRYSFHTNSGGSHGAGPPYIHHSKDFEQNIVMRTDEKGTLIAALSDDVTRHVTYSGAQIVGQSGDQRGFQLEYSTGKTSGSVSIRVSQDKAWIPYPPLPSGYEFARVNIEATEKWSTR